MGTWQEAELQRYNDVMSLAQYFIEGASTPYTSFLPSSPSRIRSHQILMAFNILMESNSDRREGSEQKFKKVSTAQSLSSVFSVAKPSSCLYVRDRRSRVANPTTPFEKRENIHFSFSSKYRSTDGRFQREAHQKDENIARV